MDGVAFGTSGWRAVIAEGFTVEAVRVVASAIGERMASRARRSCVVAHDGRFMGPRFAEEVSRALAGRGVPVLRCRGITATPVAARLVRDAGACGAIVITASHNPPCYSGLKWVTADGASPGAELTLAVEGRVASLAPADVPLADPRPRLIDPRPGYLSALRKRIDGAAFGRGRRRLRLVYDPLHGAGSGVLDRFLGRLGVEVETLHGDPDPAFGGAAPDPSEERLAGLGARLRSRKGVQLGLATDGDADRYGVMDPDGTFLEPNDVFSLLLDYLARTRNLGGAVACSVATTRMVQRVADDHGLEVRVCEIGFKHMAPLLLRGEADLAGEESAGFALADHLPDKDGMLAGALFAEMVARESARPCELLARLHRKYGPLFTRRIAITSTPPLLERLAAMQAEPPLRLAGRRVRDAARDDGLHISFGEDEWVHFRPSGTEPVIRVYAEARTRQRLDRILGGARSTLLAGRVRRRTKPRLSR
jgi:phosphomannomutase